MTTAIVTGSGGLIGFEAAFFFGRLGMDVVGVDNDMRAEFFGPEASTTWNTKRLQSVLGPSYIHLNADIRDRGALDDLFSRRGRDTTLVVHTAAQPSHDWAATAPLVDFDINAVGTLNLLEATRNHAPEAVFIFTSTNKVYGDTPNRLPLVELETRYDIDPSHEYSAGITEDMSIDMCLHSLFGASKVAADVLTQEYGRYFGMRTACFRGGTLTGPHHAATQLHGFLAYVMRCTMTGTKYRVLGYKGKQVRDAIHSSDLISAFYEVYKSPGVAEVYNIGGGRHSHVSVIEAIEMSQRIAGRELDHEYEDAHRVGDHIWWVGSNAKFEADYPDWRLTYDAEEILKEIYEENLDRWKAG